MILHQIVAQIINLAVLTWDFALSLLNLLTPPLKPKHVVPSRAPGHGGLWPPHVPPQPGDSRSACPMLNALANHGILPHSGRGIPFRALNTAVRQSFNFAPSFCFFVPRFAADFLGRSYWTDSFDLAELSQHNAIEHDASLTRQDVALEPDQAAPDLALVAALLGGATGVTPGGGKVLTKADLSRALARRRLSCRAMNREYSESLFHTLFGSANSSTMLTIFGGRVEDLTPMLTEERFADGWEPRVSSRFGLTMARFNGTVIPVERGTRAVLAEKRP
ncbi:uncharacterized protein L3040_004103 [Drepanopeziza brunnea f. sp. 'multigermtubi']|uniref:Chloroperoxidase-like protein n=1 Tax=Marssonina brunnea f. sp. multigermtubi (strain MB_m1) TaxID=1072389 RepID=K1Y125_MARBU|nr:chloroperoxidase-like protein [Drepanopeziza brunnea f. sp. 'multigermtubi' MB_m1]EKD18844.1 chloroperoxidase-like protein [Drepanopeziza brunnea f. sp. 'multigermtubi' MB_m1]KAJ5042705.1 hypothetical protein L3040_004103 [Drepanopeziza brunnea f. sp. 'multigermtubi']